MTARLAGGESPLEDHGSPPLAARRARAVLRVWGRDPIRMVQGLATADLERLGAGRAVYTAFLTPKGRMVADARILLRPGGHQPPELLLTTHPAAAPGLQEHLRKFVPPLFARFEDVSDGWAMIGVHGAGASESVRAALAAIGHVPPPPPGAPSEADGVVVPGAGEDSVVVASADPALLAVRTLETGGDGWELLMEVPQADALLSALVEAGARVGSEEELEPLRIAAGRPRWGAELTEDVIPIEAGLLDRAISQTKGCYTGQEVIVRILHRGHVNRHLRALSFRGAVPEAGTELFEPDSDKPRGVITSVAPAATGGRATGGQGLGYVRREVEPPAELRAGSPDGSPVRVSALP